MFGIVVIDESAREKTSVRWERTEISDRSVFQWNGATTLAIAGVFALATVVARFAAAKAFAGVLAATRVSFDCGTAALALAGVLAGAATVARLAATIALAGVLGLADVFF
ncbi:MAG: hypothetical protein ACI97A_000520 [Planctomycetota bacterium]